MIVLATVGLASATPSAAKENMQSIEIRSAEFKAGEALPKTASCDGEAKSPELTWKLEATNVKSFALIVDDAVAPNGTFTHWVLFDVPAATRTLPHGALNIGTAGRNDFDKMGYGPACPPKGHGVHHYHFKLFALDVEKLGHKEGAERKQVESAMANHIVGRGELIGTYERR
jgi:Raf kinase inhibitor-like YbhB/YbcL family protein